MAKKTRPEDYSTPDQRLAAFEKRLKEAEDDSNDLRKDFILIFGLFASLLAFIAVEVQVFNHITSFSDVMGVSAFLLGAFLLFALMVSKVFKESSYGLNDIIIFVVVILLFYGATECFLYSTHNNLIWPLHRYEQKTIQNK